MLIRTIFTGIVSACIALPGVSFAKGFNLQPSTGWLMDYAPDSCRLMRSFGSGNDKIIAQMIGYQPGEQFEFNLIGQPMSYVPSSDYVKVRFGSDGQFARRRAFPGWANDAPAFYLAARLDNGGSDRWVSEMGDDNKLLNNPKRWLIIDNDDGPPLASGTVSSVSSVTVLIGQRTVDLKLGSMSKPMAALRECTDDLVKGWGLDPAKQAALASRPQPLGDPFAWLRVTYPTDLAVNGERALVHFRLMIDAQGRPTSCTVQSKIEIADHFSTPGCAALMRNARFTPARTSTGEAEASYYTLRVAWFFPHRQAIDRQ